MPRISPFSGLVYDPAVAGPLEVVTAPPYDVIDEVERRTLLSSSPYSVVHLDLSEGAAGQDRYDRAAQLLADWRDEGVLVPIASPSYFVYEMRFSFEARERRIRGLLCVMELEDWGGAVLPHERTMPGPVEDRLRLLRATRANLSAVYGIVTGRVEALASLLERVGADEPRARVVDGEGVTHRLWMVRSAPGLAAALADVPMMIADGHHRYATALRYRDERRRADGPGPWDGVLTLIVDAATEDPPVLPFHRVLLGDPLPLHGARVRDLHELLGELEDRAMTVGVVTRGDAGLVHVVSTLSGTPPTVAALHDVLLGNEVDPGALRFTSDAVEAESAVRSGSASAAYLLPPTTTERIAAVVQRGERLPQKSTFFWPKPRTGMVIRTLR